MGRIVIFVYGIACYLLFFLTFLYLIAFVGNFGDLPLVAKTIDTGTPAPIGQALLINLLLIVLFAATHTVMARPWFKERWTKIVPEAAERSTYVLVSSLALIMLYWQWVPITDPVWTVTNPTGAMVLWVLYFAGYGIVLVSTLLINHFHLFGLSQVFAHLRQSTTPGIRFVEPMLYKLVRHPLYVGWIMAFWATPNMTAGHLLFAAGLTAQILISIPHEERDIEDALGEPYREYKTRTPMLVPFLKSKK